MPDRRSPHRARQASPPGQVTRSPATAAGRGRRGNQDAPAGHAALRSNGLPAHTWAICTLSAGYRIHDRAARNRRSACSDPQCSVTVCEGFVNPDRQPRAGISLQIYTARSGDRSHVLIGQWTTAALRMTCLAGGRTPCGAATGIPGRPATSSSPICRADEGISGHTVVHCTTDGCRSAWYRPRHDPPDATPSDAAGEPGGEPPSPDAGRPKAYRSIRYHGNYQSSSHGSRHQPTSRLSFASRESRRSVGV